MFKKFKKLVIFIITTVIVISALIIICISLKIDTGKIEIEGNEKYTKEELINIIFQSKWDKNPFVLYYKTKFKEQKKIPFIDEYHIEIKSLNKVKITIYEKSIIGCVDYMGMLMYFDKDGTIVESSNVSLENIPKVTGLEFDYIVLDEPLPVGDKEIFTLILDTTQALQKYKVNVEKIYISKDREVSLYIKDVQVLLGERTDLDDKIRNLSDLQNNLEGLKGTLNMKVYDESGNGYTFKKK